MKQFSILLFLFITGSCIDPLNVKNAPTSRAIVVDGLITDQPGPYVVKLYQSIEITDQLDTVHYISGATLSITDDAGGSETLTEASPGFYQTATTVGAVGKTYTLHITTPDGNTYESSPEKLLPVGDIVKLGYDFVKTNSQVMHGDLATTDGFDVTLDAQLLPEQQGRVRWRWNGTYEIQTFPQYITKQVVANGQPADIPNPPPCSGYEYVQQAMYNEDTGVTTYAWVFRKVSECSCCFCWDSEFNVTPHISDKIPGNSTTASDIKITLVPATSWHLYDKYVLDVEQLSCSPAVFQFWQEIETQELQGSDLFQTPAAATGGNIFATSKNAGAIIGIFGASAIKSQRLTFTAQDVPYALESVDSLFIECYKVFPHSSTVRPPFW